MKKLLMLFTCAAFIGLANAADIEVTEMPLSAEMTKKEMKPVAMARTVVLEKYTTKVVNNTGQAIEIEINYGGGTCASARRTLRAGYVDGVTATCCIKDVRIKVTSGPLTGQSQLIEGDITYASGTTRISCKSNVFVASIQNGRLVVERQK